MTNPVSTHSVGSLALRSRPLLRRSGTVPLAIAPALCNDRLLDLVQIDVLVVPPLDNPSLPGRLAGEREAKRRGEWLCEAAPGRFSTGRMDDSSLPRSRWTKPPQV